LEILQVENKLVVGSVNRSIRFPDNAIISLGRSRKHAKTVCWNLFAVATGIFETAANESGSNKTAEHPATPHNLKPVTTSLELHHHLINNLAMQCSHYHHAG
jgi:hypothetical protein